MRPTSCSLIRAIGCLISLATASGNAQVASAELHYYRAAEATANPRTISCDVAVYGGTPAGVTAALQAARRGRSTVLMSFNDHVGGLTSGGLTATDVGRRDSLGGMAVEFYEKLGSLVNFSPAKAEQTYRALLREAGVRVLEHQHLTSATMAGSRISAVRMEGGSTVRARVFIDATYEGDLLAAANVSYRVGREPRAAYNESLAGQWQKGSWQGVYQFCGLPISPYRIPGDPASGLLPGISSEAPGEPGDGDERVQAYNFRMFLSNRPQRVAFAKPAGYDRDRYALLGRFLNFDPKVKWQLNYTTRAMTDGPVQLRNGDSNNAGSFSSDHVGANHRWPDGTHQAVSFKKLPPERRGLPIPFGELYQIREAIFQDHVNYQQGLMFYLAHDPDVPPSLRERVLRFGLDPDEFATTGHWPHALYVREGRRMVSDHVMTQAHCESKQVAKDSVGLASYAMDSHFCQRVVVELDGVTTVRNEGGLGKPCPKPYPVSYRSIVPRKSECDNLLVPVCLSATHIAYGSIRMEPVFMILGQSAGMAADIAIANDQAVQEVDYPTLRKLLLAAGQKLE